MTACTDGMTDIHLTTRARHGTLAYMNAHRDCQAEDTTIRISAKTHELLRSHAFTEHRSQKEIVEDAIKEYHERRQKREAKD